MAFRDRFFTRRVAQAMTSPLGILLAGAGAAVGIVAGGGIPLAVGLGAAAWAGRVAAAVPRATRGDRIDSAALNPPWRQFVDDALQARRGFRGALQGARSGPLRERLGDIADRVDTGVNECWRIAQRGHELTEARRRIDTSQAQRELAELHAGGGASSASPALQRTVEALEAQLASAQRMDDVILDARDQLRLLNARLDEAVARAVELSVRAGDTADLSGLGDTIDGLVTDMEALRQGLDAVSGPGPLPATDPG